MNRWTYYSPLLIGIVIAVLSREAYAAAIPPEPLWLHVMWVTAIALAFGGVCQLVMIGIQGVSAQVVPVPGGRSIRGGAAQKSGGLLLLSVALGVTAVLLSWESLATATWIAGIAAGVAFGIAALVYIWSLPIAVADFTTQDRLTS